MYLKFHIVHGLYGEESPFVLILHGTMNQTTTRPRSVITQKQKQNMRKMRVFHIYGMTSTQHIESFHITQASVKPIF